MAAPNEDRTCLQLLDALLNNWGDFTDKVLGIFSNPAFRSCTDSV